MPPRTAMASTANGLQYNANALLLEPDTDPVATVSSDFCLDQREFERERNTKSARLSQDGRRSGMCR